MCVRVRACVRACVCACVCVYKVYDVDFSMVDPLLMKGGKPSHHGCGVARMPANKQ